MPVYVPTPDEMTQVQTRLGAAGLLGMPGEYVIAPLDDLVLHGLGSQVVGAIQPVDLAAHELSLTLTIAICMQRPPQNWDAVAAVEEFNSMQTPLLAAWAACHHTDRQKRRKIVDQATWFGAQHVWATAEEVVIARILGDPYRLLRWPPRHPPLDSRLDDGALEIAAAFLEGPPRNAGGLIPQLSACWGGDFEGDMPGVAAQIWSWLRSPFAEVTFQAGDSLEFESTEEGLKISVGGVPIVTSVPPGSRRNYLLRSGHAILTGPKGWEQEVPVGQRIVARAKDEGEAEIQLAHFVPRANGGAIAGPTLKLKKNERCTLTFDQPLVLEAWSCTCGTWACDRRHRLTGWDPAAVPPAASLKTFLQTAVKGPGVGFGGFGGYVTSMLYAVLCEGQ